MYIHTIFTQKVPVVTVMGRRCYKRTLFGDAGVHHQPALKKEKWHYVKSIQPSRIFICGSVKPHPEGLQSAKGSVFEQEVVRFGRQRQSFRQRGIHGQQEKEGYNATLPRTRRK